MGLLTVRDASERAIVAVHADTCVQHDRHEEASLTLCETLPLHGADASSNVMEPCPPQGVDRGPVRPDEGRFDRRFSLRPRDTW